MPDQIKKTVPKDGNYRTDCEHEVVRHFRRGERFPPCPEDGENVSWSPVIEAPAV